MLILVVEDDARVASFLTRGLTEEGHVADLCTRGDDAIVQALHQPYELALLDWRLPGQDGLAVLRAWRERGFDAPVIMLTARDDHDSAVLALDAGADDFVSKPFSFEELLARIRARARRQHAGGALSIAIGAARFSPKDRTITRAGTKHTLSPREFALLDYLLEHRGEVVTRSRILDAVWGMHHDPTTNVVDVYIRYLRQKLDGESSETKVSAIETIRGRGYRLRLPAESSGSEA